MKNDSTEFLVKTNNDVDEWMDSFYTEGRKHESRLHCQWAWQENERRHRSVESQLLEALESARQWIEDCGAQHGVQIMLDEIESAIAKVKGGAR